MKSPYIYILFQVNHAQGLCTFLHPKRILVVDPESRDVPNCHPYQFLEISIPLCNDPIRLIQKGHLNVSDQTVRTSWQNPGNLNDMASPTHSLFILSILSRNPLNAPSCQIHVTMCPDVMTNLEAWLWRHIPLLWRQDTLWRESGS